ncbi:MAG: TolC family protein, partial [Phycisphaerales bacterium]|nr:TolC family protein [Phycisphaerales bacterium]
AYFKEMKLPVVIVRLFNTVGPRQTGRYGMVLPRFLAAAKAGRPLIVHGDGRQTRCFCYVTDTVEALVRLQNSTAAQGQVFNVGSDEEVTIVELAERVIRALHSSSPIVFLSYEQAYAKGFQDMLRRRPDVRRAERQLAASTARVGVATADLYPRIALSGTLGVQSSQFADLFDINSRYWSIGPSITWPVFDAGRVRANIAVQDARVEQSLTQYEQVVLASYEESENAMVGFLRQQSRRASLAASVDANRRALALAEQLYSSGLADFLNVLDAQRSLFVAEEALTLSEQAVVSNLISIYKALGGGWESLASRPVEPPPEDEANTELTGS